MLRIYFFGVLQAGAAQAPWLDAASSAASKETFSLWQNNQ